MITAYHLYFSLLGIREAMQEKKPNHVLYLNTPYLCTKGNTTGCELIAPEHCDLVALNW